MKLDMLGLEAFVHVAKLGSFARAADALSVTSPALTRRLINLEQQIGVQLLERTTRQVRPTLDGEAYYQRCMAILAEIEEAEAAFTGARPAGLLRVDVQGTLAQYFMLPDLPAFLARYPDIQLRIGAGDRYVDLVREGVDCVLRVGRPADNRMVGRQIATLAEGTFASPAYLARHGTPRSPDELDGHRMIGFESSATGGVLPLEFRQGGSLREITLPLTVSATGAEMYVALARRRKRVAPTHGRSVATWSTTPSRSTTATSIG